MVNNAVTETTMFTEHYCRPSTVLTGNLANEPFERNRRILIWRLRRGYYSTDVASTGNFNLVINGQIRQIAKLKLQVGLALLTAKLLLTIRTRIRPFTDRLIWIPTWIKGLV